MIIVLQVVGIAAVLVGLLTIGVGVPVKEFSFGNTLILAGTVGLCTGLLLLGLSVVAWELRLVARRLAAARPAADPRSRPALPPFPPAAQASAAASEGGSSFSRDQPLPPSIEPSVAPPVAPPRHEDSRVRPDAQLEADASQAGAAPPPKPRRNLLFSSTMRKDRERTAAPTADSAPPNLRAPTPAPPSVPEASEAPPASFEDAWPRSGRARTGEIPPQRRGTRPAPAPAESAASATPEPPVPPPVPAEQPPVTVLKSGVVDGMAYSLYSDGSIEAQMPEGMMRFASIDELRAHLDQRP